MPRPATHSASASRWWRFVLGPARWGSLDGRASYLALKKKNMWKPKTAMVNSNSQAFLSSCWFSNNWKSKAIQTLGTVLHIFSFCVSFSLITCEGLLLLAERCPMVKQANKGCWATEGLDSAFSVTKALTRMLCLRCSFSNEHRASQRLPFSALSPRSEETWTLLCLWCLLGCRSRVDHPNPRALPYNLQTQKEKQTSTSSITKSNRDNVLLFFYSGPLFPASRPVRKHASPALGSSASAMFMRCRRMYFRVSSGASSRGTMHSFILRLWVKRNHPKTTTLVKGNIDRTPWSILWPIAVFSRVKKSHPMYLFPSLPCCGRLFSFSKSWASFYLISKSAGVPCFWNCDGPIKYSLESNKFAGWPTSTLVPWCRWRKWLESASLTLNRETSKSETWNICIYHKPKSWSKQ